MTAGIIEAVTVGVTFAAYVAAFIALIRVVGGPSSSDRIVALDIFLASAIALCLASALSTGHTAFLDVGIGLALVGSIATIGWAGLVRAPAGDAKREGPRT